MRFRLRYKPKVVDPEVHVVLSPAEVWVVTALIHGNLAGVHPVRDALGNYDPDSGFYGVVKKLFGSGSYDSLSRIGNDVEEILKRMPELEA